MAKDLKKRGFRFVGPTTAYALMQATGMVDDHLAGCHVPPHWPADRRRDGMVGMAQWAVVIPAERLAAERLYAPRDARAARPAGDGPARPRRAIRWSWWSRRRAAVAVRAGPGRAAPVDRRRPADYDASARSTTAAGRGLAAGPPTTPGRRRRADPAGPVTRLDAGPVAALTGRVDAGRQPHLAGQPGPADRGASTRPRRSGAFWSYVEELGPRELPTYVWPRPATSWPCRPSSWAGRSQPGPRRRRLTAACPR